MRTPARVVVELGAARSWLSRCRRLQRRVSRLHFTEHPAIKLTASIDLVHPHQEARIPGRWLATGRSASPDGPRKMPKTCISRGCETLASQPILAVVRVSSCAGDNFVAVPNA